MIYLMKENKYYTIKEKGMILMGYMKAIKMAIFLFPIIAFLFTIPFMLHQYHKYGSIHKLRVCIIYSFILYMMCIYFLVILPLPSMDGVLPRSEMINLHPFSFINDFLEGPFVMCNIHTYFPTLKSPSFYVAAFNIIMTIPFGMYVSYYFRYNWKETMILSFLLSLFFELTQLTGIYFIYPGAYRLFDVDDLILNTLGGVVGYIMMLGFRRFLPTREDIDRDAFLKGKEVSGLRRMMTFLLDSFLFLTTAWIIYLISKKGIVFVVVFFIFYLIIPLILKGDTLGERFLHVNIVYQKRANLFRISQFLFLYSYYFMLPIVLFYIVYSFSLSTAISFWLYLLTTILVLLFWLSHMIRLFRHRYLYYDKFFYTTYQSSLHYEDEQEENEISTNL